MKYFRSKSTAYIPVSRDATSILTNMVLHYPLMLRFNLKAVRHSLQSYHALLSCHAALRVEGCAVPACIFAPVIS